MLFVSCAFASITKQGVFVSLISLILCFRGTHIKRLVFYGSVSPSNVDPLALERQGISRVLSHGVIFLGKGNQQRGSGRSLCVGSGLLSLWGFSKRTKRLIFTAEDMDVVEPGGLHMSRVSIPGIRVGMRLRNTEQLYTQPKATNKSCTTRRYTVAFALRASSSQIGIRYRSRRRRR